MAMEGPDRQPFQRVIGDLSAAIGGTAINFLVKGTFSEITGRWARVCFLIDTGTHACNEWQRHDSVRIVCLTNSHEATFWAVVKERLNFRDTFAGPAGSVLVLSDASLQLGPDVHPAVKEIRSMCRTPEIQCTFSLHYCKKPDDFVMAVQTATGISTHLDLVYEMQNLGREVHIWPEKPQDDVASLPPPLSLSYRTLRLWARTNGILGGSSGYFDGMTLLWVAAGAYDTLVREQIYAVVNASLVQGLTLTRLRAYISDSAPPEHAGFIDSATWLEPPKIFAPSGRPVTNHMKIWAVDHIKSVLQKWEPNSSMAKYEDHSEASTVQLLQDGWNNFMNENATYVLVRRRTWGQTPGKRDCYRNRAHKIAMAIAKELSTRQRLPIYDPGKFTRKPRLWPELLVEKDGSGEEETFAIAFGPGEWDEIQLRIVEDVLTTAELGNLKNLPEPANANDTPALINTRYVTTIDSFIPESMFEPPASAPPTTNEIPEPQIAGTSFELPFRTAPQPQISGNTFELTFRFRTASQAISRLRHDPAHNAIEYDLAYEDRFAGLMWMPLEEWGGRATEDEDFIPEHRVRRIKRRSDDVVVWDRNERIDRTGG